MCLQSGGRIIGGLFANEGFFFTFFWGGGGVLIFRRAILRIRFFWAGGGGRIIGGYFPNEIEAGLFPGGLGKVGTELFARC